MSNIESYLIKGFKKPQSRNPSVTPSSEASIYKQDLSKKLAPFPVDMDGYMCAQAAGGVYHVHISCACPGPSAGSRQTIPVWSCIRMLARNNCK